MKIMTAALAGGFRRREGVKEYGAIFGYIILPVMIITFATV